MTSILSLVAPSGGKGRGESRKGADAGEWSIIEASCLGAYGERVGIIY